MLANALTHWKSTLFGVLGAALGAFATTANLDKLTASQAAMAFLGCLVFALKGAVSADAQPSADAAKVK